jgi:hypothetical protein
MPRPRRADRGEYKPLSTRGRVVEAVRVNLLGSFRVSVGRLGRICWGREVLCRDRGGLKVSATHDLKLARH